MLHWLKYSGRKGKSYNEYIEHGSTLYICVPTEKYLHNLLLKHDIT